MSNNQNNPQDSKMKIGDCFYVGNTRVMCGRINPQEVPQVKSVDRTPDQIIQDIKEQFPLVGAKTGVQLCMKRFSDQENANLQSRIAELEKQNSELREVLTNVMYPKLSKSTDEAQEQWYDILIAAEQALNPKDNG